MAAYNSAFHAARALLFAKGYTERSHFCLGVALRGLYSGKIIDLLKIFDKIRLSRHNVQYGGALVSEDEAEFVIEFARDFLIAAKTELMVLNDTRRLQEPQRVFCHFNRCHNLEANLGLVPDGAAAVCIKPKDLSRYEAARAEIEDLLKLSFKETRAHSSKFTYQIMIALRPIPY